MKQLVLGNWKSHGSIQQVRSVLNELAEAQFKSEVGVCVPFPYLMLAKQSLQATCIKLGAQNVSQYHAGAYTGEVSAEMLVDVGCEVVLVAHSERRCLLSENTEQAGFKIQVCIDAGLYPVYCVGESADQRRAGLAETVILSQLSVVKNLSGEQFAVAYEPTWAIGSGETASMMQIEEMVTFIRESLNDPAARVLYGGSVKADNASEILSLSGVGGVLVGGASLHAGEFIKIAHAVS